MTTSNTVFRDASLAEKMERDGYIILPFLDEEDIRFFKKLYKRHHSTDPEHFYKSYFSSDMAYKLEVEQEIIAVFNRKLGKYFKDIFAFGGMFVAKPPLEKGHFTAHQDWSFVDEFQFPSYNMWSPLTDVNDQNGNLNVLKGSHFFIETKRGYNTPDVYDHLHDLIEPNMVSLPMKAGEVVIFYHGLVHGSTKNLTAESRVSLGLSLVHKDAELKYYYYDEQNKVLEEYASNTDFYIQYVDTRNEKPKSIPFNVEVDFDFPRLTESELKEKIIANHGTLIAPKAMNLSNQIPPRSTLSFFKKFKNIFLKK